MKQVSGFSKRSKDDKIKWLAENYFEYPQKAIELFKLYWHRDEKLQRLHDEFSENTISNYYLPFGIAPNFVINGKTYAVPMAVEESSVVAAASKTAKYWKNKGGFATEILGTVKRGQVHFMYAGDREPLNTFFKQVKADLKIAVRGITRNMEKRGGGLKDIQLINKTNVLQDYYQLECTFETVDAMGANFINSCLETIADTFEKLSWKNNCFKDYPLQIVMAILSNYVPECKVRAEVSCPVEDLFPDAREAHKFADKFVQAVNIAEVEPARAVTHNKGIMNGIDAVVVATGNDFRAVEACAHAFAARNGKYSSLSAAEVKDGVFRFWMEIPLALGTVGGLTRLHPLVKMALEILQNPSSEELMSICATVGLAQNFAAVKSLVTTGIQEGHMKMHLMNILNQFDASDCERKHIVDYFKDNVVSYNAVLKALTNLRNK